MGMEAVRTDNSKLRVGNGNPGLSFRDYFMYAIIIISFYFLLSDKWIIGVAGGGYILSQSIGDG
jgi:hypothetical protein